MEEKGIQLCFNPNIHLTVPVSNYCGRRRGLGLRFCTALTEACFFLKITQTYLSF